MTTDVDATEQPPGPSSAPIVASPTTGEPVKLFSRQWISGVLAALLDGHRRAAGDRLLQLPQCTLLAPPTTSSRSWWRRRRSR